MSAHQMGTARMGSDYKQSVVDPSGESWDVAGGPVIHHPIPLPFLSLRVALAGAVVRGPPVCPWRRAVRGRCEQLPYQHGGEPHGHRPSAVLHAGCHTRCQG